MRYLLEPAVRLMNRLSYAKKFTLIGVLIVIQAAALIFMLVSELNKNIEMLSVERQGVHYCRALIRLLDEAQTYRTLQFAFTQGDHSLKTELLARQGRVDKALAAVGETDKSLGANWGTDWQLDVLRREWDMRKLEATQFEADRAQVAFLLHSRWIGNILDFTQQVGNSSRLALDNDLDTAYLADSILRKMPALLDTATQARAFSRNLPAGKAANFAREQVTLIAGLANSTLEQLDRNAQIALRRNAVLKKRLNSLHEAVNDALPIFTWNFEQKLTSAQGQAIPQQLLDAAGDRAVNSILTLTLAELDTADLLLEQRMERNIRDRNGLIGFTLGILLLVCFLFLAFDTSVRRGLYQLNELMDQATKGNLKARGMIRSNDEMAILTDNINSMLDSLEMMVGEVQRSHDRLESWNQELEQTVTERTASLRNLLNHAGQGFLSFGADLKVAGEYSAECRTIFGREIGGELVTQLFYAEDREQRSFLAALFQKLFQEDKETLRATYFSLLPEELLLNGKTIGVAYKWIARPGATNEREIMLILTDLTHQKAMECKMEEEKNTLAMVVRVVTHANDFFNTVRQYQVFCQEDFPALLIVADRPGDRLDKIFRAVHTFKGTFGQLGLRGIVKELHSLEERLTSLRARSIDGLTPAEAAAELGVYSPTILMDWLEADMDVLRDILGDAFFAQEDTVIVDAARLLEIEGKIQNLLTPVECRLLLPDLRRLRFKSVKDLLESYPEYVLALAEKNEKMVRPFPIISDDLILDPLKYNNFVKSLGHVFRNAIAHGLETPDERLAADKDELGTITCTVREMAQEFSVSIADDGRGIDPVRIREIAVNKGILDRQTAATLSNDDSIRLIFADGFSSAEEVNQFAGRGVGLSAVRAEVEKLGGRIEIHSRLGHGTEFCFVLPLLDLEVSEAEPLTAMIRPLLTITKDRLADYAVLAIKDWGSVAASPDGKLPLLNVTTFVDIKGSLHGRVVVSASDSLVKWLGSRRQPEQAEDSQDSRWQENILSRLVGEIFDDALAQLQNGEGEAIIVDALVTILAEDASAKYPQTEISTWQMDTQAGCLKLSFIYPQN